MHQFVTIGSYSFVGGLSRVLHDVPPYMLVEGIPARPRCINIVALKRNNFRRSGSSLGRGPSAAVPRRRWASTHAREILARQQSARAAGERAAGVHRGPAGRQARPRPRSEESRVSRLRLAVVGAGHLGRIHARLAAGLPEIELVGGGRSGREPREARGAGDRAPARSPTIRELIGEIDAAVVATPTLTHHAVGRRADSRRRARAGRKAARADARARPTSSSQLARSRHVVLQVGHVERFNPALVSGRLRTARAEVHRSPRQSGYTFRSTDVGVVLDLMIHDIDVALCSCNRRVRTFAPGRVGDGRPRGHGQCAAAVRQRLRGELHRLAD